jgi:hypothetical protein
MERDNYFIIPLSISFRFPSRETLLPGYLLIETYAQFLEPSSACLSKSRIYELPSDSPMVSYGERCPFIEPY